MHRAQPGQPSSCSLAALTPVAAYLPLPLADSIIYATAQRYRAILWTQDEHIQDLPGVKFFPKRQ